MQVIVTTVGNERTYYVVEKIARVDVTNGSSAHPDVKITFEHGQTHELKGEQATQFRQKWEQIAGQ